MFFFHYFSEPLSSPDAFFVVQIIQQDSPIRKRGQDEAGAENGDDGLPGSYQAISMTANLAFLQYQKSQLFTYSFIYFQELSKMACKLSCLYIKSSNDRQ